MNYVKSLTKDEAYIGNITNELQIFNSDEFGQVRTIEIDGKPYFVGKDVAESLGYSNPRDALKRHCRGVVKRDAPTDGGTQQLSFISEGDMYRLITHSKLESAERFESWVFDEVLPSIRKKGAYSNRSSKIEQSAFMVKFVADDLRVNEASRLLMYENMCKDFSIPTGFLPKYEHNGNRQMKSLTVLLKENQCGVSAVKFNTLLIQNGYLEERERPSSIGKSKKFKALTEKGLKYGENVVSPHNQKEVQPLYYSDTFAELFNNIREVND